MVSKSIPERSAPHVGMGRLSKSARLLRRNCRIQGGSPFISEICSTIFLLSPRSDLNVYFSAMWNPAEYVCCCVLSTLVLIRIYSVSYDVRSGNLSFLFLFPFPLAHSLSDG